jgi:hydrogenase nickel insertion protein HypA
MHEMSIIESMLAALGKHFQGRLPGAPRRVVVQVGRFVQVNETALREAFSAATEGKPWGEADLQVEAVDPTVVCKDCKAECAYPASRCSKCGSVNLEVRGGFEFIVKEVAFEVEDSCQARS